jgi:hypothetical protein
MARILAVLDRQGILGGRHTDMKQETHKIFGLKRLAWIAAALVVLRIATWDLHHLLDQHDYQANVYCDVCLVVERSGDGVATDHGHAPTASVDAECRHAPAALLQAAIPPSPLPRGPPSLPV